MPLFILTETSAGYALLKAKDKKLLQRENLSSEIGSVEQICSLLKLKDFQKFDSAAVALEEVSALIDGKVTPRLASLLETIKDEKKASLAVADPKLGTAINKLPQFSITPISDSTTSELYRSIRDHLSSLIPGLLPSDISTMSLGLSHSLSRHKLRFSPDKIDTMIVQAIALLDDLDKELNTYAMRLKEWYGWHFPEMQKIINDNLAYARVLLKMGMRTNAADTDLADILPEEIEMAVKAAAEVSMGTEMTAEDLDNIQALAEQVVNFNEYRQQLSSYLSARMAAVAPNLTAIVGELVGARLIAHAGSLMNLAKSPASTIQILGAEKALFRALKTKHDTPKYGLIFHASLIGQATGKNKGKIARVLAAKAALGLRNDALSDWSAEGEGKGDLITEEEKAAFGIASRVMVERRLATLEGKPPRSRGIAIAPNVAANQPSKWDVKEARKYNPDADGLAGNEPAAAVPSKKKRSIEEIIEVQMTEAGDDEIEAEDESEDNEVDAEEDEAFESDVLNKDKQDEKANEESDDDEDEGDEKDIETFADVNGASSSNAKSLIMNDLDENNEDKESVTISTVSADTADSADSPTQQELNWQSSILGNTKAAKKARKIERHERRLALSEERSQKKTLKKEKLARRLDRKERRLKREEQISRREDRDRQQYGALALQAGLSITRYKRKLERGEIKFLGDGTPIAISKKEIKKARKQAEKSEKEMVEQESAKKRKREDEEGKSEKKKKKKSMVN